MKPFKSLRHQRFTQDRCGVQFDYGLKQGRSLPVSKRLTSFQTDKGKIVNVESEIAVRNDVQMKAGRVINAFEEKKSQLMYMIESPCQTREAGS